MAFIKGLLNNQWSFTSAGNWRPKIDDNAAADGELLRRWHSMKMFTVQLGWIADYSFPYEFQLSEISLTAAVHFKLVEMSCRVRNNFGLFLD